MDLFKEKTNEYRKRNSSTYPTVILNNKVIGYEFAAMCSMNTPKVFQLGEPLEKILFLPKTVIKPMYEHSSKGIFIVNDIGEIKYLNSNVCYESVSSAKKIAFSLLKKKTIRTDLWMVEELLEDDNSIARDIKFYCFYGDVGLILESDRNDGTKRCWYDSDLNYTTTGKYDEHLYEGNKERLSELKKIAEHLSQEIPSAFVRIDFLIHQDTVYVGEFTPVPSNYDEFNDYWDRLLGEMLIAANISLSHDVANGKTFDLYNKLNKSERNLIRKSRAEI